MENTVQEVLKYLLQHEVQVELELLDGEVGYNLNTQAKSELVWYPTKNLLTTRYSSHHFEHEHNDVESVVKELCYEVRDCMGGRVYVNHNWLELMEKFNT